MIRNGLMFSTTIRLHTTLTAVAGLGLTGCGMIDPSDDSRSEPALTEQSQPLSSSDRQAVYVMDNVATRNAVLRFSRSDHGRLTPAGIFPTGGLGTGAGLGSQGAVILTNGGRRLYVVNAGSDEISSLEVFGDYLVLRDIVPSGGANPVSLTVHGDLLYVVNAGRGDTAGNITGFHIDHGSLAPLAGATRSLSAAAAGPAQIGFAPDGRALVVTEKATDELTTYAIDPSGIPGEPIVTPSHGQTPFGFAFDDRGTLIVSEAFGGAPGGSALSSYRLGSDAAPVLISGSVPTSQTAACWVAVGRGDRDAFTTNTGSDSVSAYKILHDGSIERFNDGGVTAAVGHAPSDLAFTQDRRVLFVRDGGAGTIDTVRENHDGTLDVLDHVTGLPSSAAGLAAY